MQCYIRCYLDAVGIIKDDELNREKASEMQWATSEDTLDECQKDVTGIFTAWFLFTAFPCVCVCVMNFNTNFF